MGATVALVALSGHDDPATVRGMLASGFVGYAVKGTGISEFLALVAAAAGRPGRRRCTAARSRASG